MRRPSLLRPEPRGYFSDEMDQPACDVVAVATSNELGLAAPGGIPRHTERIHRKGKSLEEDLELLVESVTWGTPGGAQQSQAYTIEFPLD
jgi:hypothetical protein